MVLAYMMYSVNLPLSYSTSRGEICENLILSYDEDGVEVLLGCGTCQATFTPLSEMRYKVDFNVTCISESLDDMVKFETCRYMLLMLVLRLKWYLESGGRIHSIELFESLVHDSDIHSFVDTFALPNLALGSEVPDVGNLESVEEHVSDSSHNEVDEKNMKMKRPYHIFSEGELSVDGVKDLFTKLSDYLTSHNLGSTRVGRYLIQNKDFVDHNMNLNETKKRANLIKLIDLYRGIESTEVIDNMIEVYYANQTDGQSSKIMKR